VPLLSNGSRSNAKPRGDSDAVAATTGTFMGIPSGSGAIVRHYAPAEKFGID
jgi:hypothetical protein